MILSKSDQNRWELRQSIIATEQAIYRNRIVAREQLRTAQLQLTENYDLLHQFRSTITVTRHCKQCEKQNCSETTLFTIPIFVPPGRDCSIQDCVDLDAKERETERECPSCKHRVGSEWHEFTVLPRVFLINLLGNCVTSGRNTRGDDARSNLQLSPTLTVQRTTYLLRAATVYFGNGIGGHYIAHILVTGASGSRWFEINGDWVFMVTDQQVLVNSHAVQCFYERI